MQVELLEWNFWHGAELSLARLFGSGRTGLGLKFVTIFRINFRPAYKAFL